MAPAAPVLLLWSDQDAGTATTHALAALAPPPVEVRGLNAVQAALGEAGSDDAVVLLGRATFGTAATREVRTLKEAAGTRVVLLTGDGSSRTLRRALDAGVDGCVLNDAAPETLTATIAAVRAGQICIPGALRAQALKPSLTSREKQILGMVVLGLPNAEIAGRLHVTEKTVKTHLSQCFAKLGVTGHNEATRVILDPKNGYGAGILPGSPRTISRPSWRRRRSAPKPVTITSWHRRVPQMATSRAGARSSTGSCGSARSTSSTGSGRSCSARCSRSRSSGRRGDPRRTRRRGTAWCTPPRCSTRSSSAPGGGRRGARVHPPDARAGHGHDRPSRRAVRPGHALRRLRLGAHAVGDRAGLRLGARALRDVRPAHGRRRARAALRGGGHLGRAVRHVARRHAADVRRVSDVVARAALRRAGAPDRRGAQRGAEHHAAHAVAGPPAADDAHGRLPRPGSLPGSCATRTASLVAGAPARLRRARALARTGRPLVPRQLRRGSSTEAYALVRRTERANRRAGKESFTPVGTDARASFRAVQRCSLDMRRFLLLALALLAMPTSTAAADTKLADVTIPASDGVNLVGDVHLPGDGKARTRRSSTWSPTGARARPTTCPRATRA